MKHALLVGATVLASLSSPRLRAAPITFVDPTPGPAAQIALESSFLAATPSLRTIDFNDVPRGPVTGFEWVSSGVIIENLDSDDLFVVDFSDPAFNGVCNTVPNCLFPVPQGEQVLITLTLMTPSDVFGLWIIDSDVQSGNDAVRFLDSNDQEIASILMPWSNTVVAEDRNFFIGLISDVPIASVHIDEQLGDAEKVGIDTFYFVPEPGILSLLALMLGVLGFCRRPLRSAMGFPRLPLSGSASVDL